jgi:tetratricopeptide (TPR) repeat protein
MQHVPFDVSYRFPEGQLRAAPNDREQMTLACAWLEAEANLVTAAIARAKLLGIAGGYTCMVGEIKRAKTLLNDALDVAASEGDARLAATQRTRLADVIAASGYPCTAASTRETLLTECGHDERLRGLTDFIHQHLGKALAKAGRIEEAIAHFELALALRAQVQDDDLVASTRHALGIALRMLTSNDDARGSRV